MEVDRIAFDSLVRLEVGVGSSPLYSPDSALRWLSARAEDREQVLRASPLVEAMPPAVVRMLMVLDTVVVWGSSTIREFSPREGEQGIPSGVVLRLVDVVARATAAREVWFQAFMRGAQEKGGAASVIAVTIHEVVGEMVRVVHELQHTAPVPLAVTELLQQVAEVQGSLGTGQSE